MTGIVTGGSGGALTGIVTGGGGGILTGIVTGGGGAQLGPYTFGQELTFGVSCTEGPTVVHPGGLVFGGNFETPGRAGDEAEAFELVAAGAAESVPSAVRPSLQAGKLRATNALINSALRSWYAISSEAAMSAETTGLSIVLKATAAEH